MKSVRTSLRELADITILACAAGPSMVHSAASRAGAKSPQISPCPGQGAKRMAKLSDYVVFNDTKLASKYQNRPIAIATLYEAYFDGAVDIPGDLFTFLRDRNQFVKYSLTKDHLRWAMTNF